ncbi:N-acetylgalactosamine-6-sulfatase [Roseivirga sp. 4D4]|uniref:arylsulfatase n=1 Tax=Roseivirga sp. 4D4 TaxID=1889784 RepID=UPI000852BD3D|nr:arylsulfatase [Roseivirga sp. 4D4]OEK01503.1 N-acetylgalactosamine-6-sulfatase [Roseivirga sp. 4D4]
MAINSLLHRLTFLMLPLLFFGCKEEQDAPPPNIILIVADDLGYGELGSYGQKIIETPHLDALAAGGMRFTQFYAGSPVCAPSRYVLMTGMHTGHSFIRGNDEWKERGNVWNYKEAIKNPGLEGQRPIPDSTLLLSEVMKTAGYETAVIGKWGLGAPFTEGEPNQQGFDYFYGYNCQRQAHNLYPAHLWENDHKVALANDTVPPGTKLPETADPNLDASYANYYQADYAPAKMQESALDFIKDRDTNKPFMLYYATPIPHVPLQVPEEYVMKYHEIIGEEEPYLGQKGYFPHKYPKAAYAGMISYLDDQVGELIATLKAEGIYENTIIMFTSDNGPTYAGGVDADFFNSAGIFPNEYGRTKGFTYEGGIRVPMIASWPGKIAHGTTSDHISAFYDIMPTLSELGGLASPKNIDGLSFAAELMGRPQSVHDYLYWEFPEYKGQQAVRLGDYKGIRKNMFEGNLEIELYDLAQDPTESNDISNSKPEIVAEIKSIMEEAHEDAALPNFRIPIINKSKED